MANPPPTPQLENKFSSDFFDTDNESPRAQRLRAMAGQTPRDRQAALTERQAEAAVCDNCGSSWFCEVEFNQYRSGTYSSAPGGDLDVINPMPMRIRVCACGKPYRPNVGGAFHGGRTPNEQMGSFAGSLEKAIAAFESNSTEASVAMVVQAALNQVLTPYEIRIAELEGLLQKATAPEPPPNTMPTVTVPEPPKGPVEPLPEEKPVPKKTK